MSDHHRFLIRQSLRHIRYIEEMIEELDKEIAVRLKPYQQQLKLACNSTGNQAQFSRQHPGRNGNGHASRRTVSRLPSLGIVGDRLPRQR
jgi:hypothetical protein